MSTGEIVNKLINYVRGLPINCALAAVSGGVDSTTSAVLVRRAIGDKLKAIFVDTGFMRLNEPEEIKETLRGILPLDVINAKEEFLGKMLGLSDAEEKRIKFRDVFYKVLSRLAINYGCEWLVQGTIAPDWIETKGGIKTQHNVLEQIGIDSSSKFGFKLIEPLKELYKDQVRDVARYLGIPRSIVERQPFPGPGLSIRAVGKLSMEKLELVRWASSIVENKLSHLGLSQWFAAAWEDITTTREDMTRYLEAYGELEAELFHVRATGVKGDSRAYGSIVLVRGNVKNWESIYEFHEELTTRYDATHVIYELSRKSKGRFFVTIRAVVTEDYMTADVARINRDILMDLARELLNHDSVSAVGIDVTPKPPATIEFE